MEFGEKLKKTREEKGMTQQALAEQLFVTRQAVSRWENGARYPDIITVRKLARILDVSIDELLLDEETHDLVKKTPVIEDRKEEKAQTAVYVAAALPYLMHVLGMVWEMKRKMTAAEDVGYAAAGAALSVVCLCVMLFGAYQSAVGKMDRRMICVMTAAYFLTGAGTRILSVISENTGSGGTLFYPYIVILAVMSAVTLLLLAGI